MGNLILCRNVEMHLGGILICICKYSLLDSEFVWFIWPIPQKRATEFHWIDLFISCYVGVAIVFTILDLGTGVVGSITHI